MHSLFLSELHKLKIRFPVAEIVKKTGFTNGTVSEYINSKKQVSPRFFRAFCDAYGLDYDKLVGSTPPTPEVIPVGRHVPARLAPEQYGTAFPDWQGVPMYNMPITASFINSYRDESGIAPQYYFRDPYFKDCDFGAVIAGDSMHSEIRHGDFVVLKEVTDLAFVIYGDIYYVVATNGLETCKYLNEDPKNPDNYLLVPRSERISPSPIPKNMVLKLYKVKGIIRGY